MTWTHNTYLEWSRIAFLSHSIHLSITPKLHVCVIGMKWKKIKIGEWKKMEWVRIFHPSPPFLLLPNWRGNKERIHSHLNRSISSFLVKFVTHDIYLICVAYMGFLRSFEFFFFLKYHMSCCNLGLAKAHSHKQKINHILKRQQNLTWFS